MEKAHDPSTAEVMALLPDGSPGITARELFTKINGFDPGPDMKSKHAWQMKKLRKILYDLNSSGKATIIGSMRFPPLRWTR